MSKETTAVKVHKTEHPVGKEQPLARRMISPFTEMQNRMDSFLDNFMTGYDIDFLPAAWQERIPDWSPRFEITETDETYEMAAELPGMDEKDIEVFVEDDVLTVKGEKKQEREEKRRNYHLTERSYGTFQRSFPLPRGLHSDKVKATFKKGVLSLTLPKTEEAKAHRRKIEIK